MSSDYQPQRAWLTAAMLFLLVAINFMDKVVLGLVATPLMGELGLSPEQYGLLAGSFFFLFALMGVVGGFLSNRYPTRWLLLAMAALWALIQLPIAFSDSLTVLVACRVLLGAGEGPAQPVAIHACYKWFPDSKRNLPVSVFQQGGVFGMIVAGLAVPWFDRHWGWRSNFLVLAALGIAWCLLWLALGREGSLDGSRRVALPRSGNDAAAARIDYRTLLADRTVVCVIALHFTAFLTLALVFTWLPAYLGQGLHYAPRRAGQLFALVALATAPVSLLLSAWSQRMIARGAASGLARAALICGCMAASGAVFLVAAVCPLSPACKVAAIAMALSPTPVIYSLGPAILAQIAPPSQRGALLAIEYSVAWIAGIVAPPTVGWLIHAAHDNVATGFERGLLLCGALLVVVAMASVRAMNPERSLQRITRRQAA